VAAHGHPEWTIDPVNTDARGLPDLGAAVASITAPAVAAITGGTRAGVRDEVRRPVRTLRDARLSNIDRGVAWLTVMVAAVPLIFAGALVEHKVRHTDTLMPALALPLILFAGLTGLVHLGRLSFLGGDDELEWAGCARWRRILCTPSNLDPLIPAVIVGFFTAVVLSGV